MAMMVGAGSGSNEPPCPPGRAYAVCIDVYPIKRRSDNAEKVRFRWCVYFVNGQPVRRQDGSFYFVKKDYSPSMHENAWLRKDMERLRGKPYTVQQIEARVDVERVIGVTAELLLVPGSNPAFTNIDAILPAPAGYTLPIPADYKRVTPNDPSLRGGTHAGPGMQQVPPPATPPAYVQPAPPQQGYPPQGTVAAPPAGPPAYTPPAAAAAPTTYENYVAPPLEDDSDLPF